MSWEKIKDVLADVAGITTSAIMVIVIGAFEREEDPLEYHSKPDANLRPDYQYKVTCRCGHSYTSNNKRSKCFSCNRWHSA